VNHSNSLVVKVPSENRAEVEYSIRVVLSDFLGLSYSVEYVEGPVDYFEISAVEKKLRVSCAFFNCIQEKGWLTKESLPSLPLRMFSLKTYDIVTKIPYDSVPILYGEDSFSRGEDYWELGIDIFGSSFFMLSRYEEGITRERDSHERFSAKSSVAYVEGFIGRPIVNEYVEILWALLSDLWPDLNRKENKFKMNVTADMDRPYTTARIGFLSFLKRFVGDLIFRKSLVEALATCLNFSLRFTNNYIFDANCRSIFWMMKENEKKNNKITFFFIAKAEHFDRDGYYDISSPVIKDLISKILSRGHRVGLHGSYRSFDDLDRLSLEKNNLREELGKKVACFDIGIRMHYLRWNSEITPSVIDRLDFVFDSTLGYADHIGFRSGVCFPYPLYDLKTRRSLSVVEIPLVVMECAASDPQNMGLRYSKKMLDAVNCIKQEVVLYGGTFTLLWHNSSLVTRKERWVYKNII